MSRCHHGYPIQESWEECPDCCAEHDAMKAAEAAQDVAEESRKQTRILEELARNSGTKSSREETLEKEIERLKRENEELKGRK